MSIHDSRDSVGRAGLMSLMGDQRYTDGTHPEHDMVVDMIRRGFELVIGEAGAPGFTTLFDNDVADGRRIDLMNSDARAAFGRGLLLQAIRAEGRRGHGEVRASGAGDRPGHRRSQGAAKTTGTATAAETASSATGDAAHARQTSLTG